MALDFPALLRRFEHARNNRANWNTIWQDIADRVWPTMADFTTKRSDGQQRTEKMLDSTATQAAQRALAAITSFFWPSNQRYQKLSEDSPKPGADKTQTAQAVQVYLDAQTERLFRARYSPRASFESQMSEAGMSFLVFGTGILFIDDMLTVMGQPGILYKSVPLSQAYLEENAAGKIDTLHRCWPWTLRQIEQRFPGKLPERLAKRLETHPDEKIDIAQTVCPRDDYQPSGVGGINMPFASVYFIPGEKALLEESGFRCFPFAIMRFMTSSGEIYGRSPAWMAMSNIRTLNTMKRTSLSAAQKIADLTMLTTEDSILDVFSNAPGAMVYGGLNDNGQELVKPLATGGNVGLTLEMMDKEREIISAGFFLDVFKALVENPQMTATQALELMQERATLMAPIGGRIESEGLGPMTERELDILGHAGQLDPPPQELIARNGAYKIDYTSPMRQAMRASEAIAITRTLEQLLPLAQEDPSVLDVFVSLAVVGRELAEINGVPAKLLNDLATILALKDQRTQEANAQAAVQAAPQIAMAAKNLTQAQAAGGRPQL